MKACGDLIVTSREVDEHTVMRVRQSHSPAFKTSVRDYVKAYNRAHRTQVSVAFPSPFTMTLRVVKRTARSKPSNPEPRELASR